MALQLSCALPSYFTERPGHWDFVINRARLIDAAGVDRLRVSDHVVMGERLDAYGRPELGGQLGELPSTGPDGIWLEPLTLLSVVAGATTRVRLATSIMQAALRRPIVLAKATATLDVLSGGRLDLGVGVGWQREEYEAAGLVFEKRGALLDDTLAVCQTLWTQPRASYQSPYTQFENLHLMPKPLQAGGVPIWVAGNVNARVARRIARFGAGWIPWTGTWTDTAAAVQQMKAALSEMGHDPSGLGVVGSLKPVNDRFGNLDLDATMAVVPHLAQAGVTDIRSWIELPDDDNEAEDLLGRLVEAFRIAAERPSTDT